MKVKNPKTTYTGIGMILAAAASYFLGETTLAESLIAGATGLGLLLAKDHNK